MSSNRSRPWLPLILVLAAAAAALNIIGAVQLGRIPDFGYSRVGNNVQQVVPGGPADRAGFRDGDELLAIEGAAIGDAAALARLPRAEVGAMRHYRLARGDDEIEATLVPGPLPIEQRIGARINALIGLAFLAVGLVAFTRRGGGLGTSLAVLGVAAAVVMGNPPFRLFAPSFAPALMWLWNVLGLVAAASFVHFAMFFPRPRPRALARWLLPAIYGPVAVWGVAAGLGLSFPVFWFQLPYVLLGCGLLLMALKTTHDPGARLALVRFLWLMGAAVAPFLTIGVLSSTGAVTNPFVSQLGSIALVLIPVALAWTVLPHAVQGTACRAPTTDHRAESPQDRDDGRSRQVV